MEAVELGEALKVLDSAISRAKWRLRAASKRRLETDILALCSRMRAVIMVDYGGKMPELQERLCEVLKLCQKDSPMYLHLKVMVIDEMIYLIHVQGFAEFVRSSLNSEVELFFVDLETDPPKMIRQTENSSAVMQLISVQKIFSSVFPVDGTDGELHPSRTLDLTANNTSTTTELLISQSAELIDLSSLLQETEVTIPTLNGWLLGYPVVYLFGKEHISDAIYNLSTKSLHLFKVFVRRNDSASSQGSREDELMSFSVPYDLSLEGSSEPWAETYLADVRVKWDRCKNVWSSLRMEVSGCYPQAIAL